jgi:Family of unknown function (DUF6644)
MVDAAPAIFVALEQSGFSAAVRQSPWIYPAANIGHILALAVFAGAVALMDVGLLAGSITSNSARDLARARICAIAAFVALVITGFTLFSAEASHLAINPVFQVKLVLIAAALVNAALYELFAARAMAKLPPGAAIPAGIKLVGVLSLGIWICVAACGRSIAYF